MHILMREQYIDANLKEVFTFFSRPENLQKITPPSMGFRILTPSPVPMHSGAIIDYTLNVSGIPFRWTTLISEYDPPNKFVDIQLKGPYSFWHHTHTFEQTDRGIKINDKVLYRLPFGPFGDLIRQWFVSGQLEQVFTYRAWAIAREFKKDCN